ncbi:hypothetical protein EXT46_14990 [Pseudoalteromonas sp. CO325X]|uniref:hypothetical protein n=1 Tax=Pseudoalteromonas sp. CO325X TaxID=1777262 RepID=UPI00102392D4|nr:hypothetical protein [Pseudoalteromonas sp. CO325X]RZF79194.1 hypothetical protein EXT46_14990 [Pseudoalteromonas sp. CO325X]
MSSNSPKALVVSYQFSENGSVASHRNIGFVTSLLDEGFDVTVLTCKELSEPFLSNQVQFISITNPFLRALNKLFSSAKETTPSTPSQKSGVLSLLLKFINNYRKSSGILFLGRMPDVSDIWYFIVKKHLKKREEKWDVVISSYAPYSNLLIGSYLKKKKRTKVFIADYRDPWLTHHLFKGVRLLHPLEKLLEKKVNSSADLICAATPLLCKLTNADNVLAIKNGFYGLATPNTAKQRQSPLVLVHTGSIYKHKQDIEPFFVALTQVKKRLPNPIRVYFAGNEYEHIVNLAIKHGLTEIVHHYGQLDKSHCETLLKEAHAGVSFDLNDEKFLGIIPVKVNEYIKYDLAILQMTKVTLSDATEHLKAFPKYTRCDYHSDNIATSILKLNELAQVSTPPALLESYSQKNANAPLLSYIKKRVK